MSALDYALNPLLGQPSNRTFAIDITAPTYTVVFDCESRTCGLGPLALTATFSEAGIASAPEISIAGGAPATDNDEPGLAMTPTTNLASWNYFRQIQGNGVDDGLFQIDISAADPAGNQLVEPSSLSTYVVDTLAPQVLGLTPSRGPEYLVAGPFSVTVEFSEPMLESSLPSLLVSGPASAVFTTPNPVWIDETHLRFDLAVDGDTNPSGQ